MTRSIDSSSPLTTFGRALRQTGQAGAIAEPEPAPPSTAGGIEALANRVGELQASLEKLRLTARDTLEASQIDENNPGFVRLAAVKRQLAEVVESIAGLFRERFDGVSDEVQDGLRQALAETVQDSFDGQLLVADSDVFPLRSGFGLDFDFRPEFGPAASLDVRRFTRAASEDFEALQAFLFEDDPADLRDGVVVALIGQLGALGGTLGEALDASVEGFVVDLVI